MVGLLDGEAGTLNMVSIPRDTLVNASGESKRLRLVYNEGGAEALRQAVAGLLGFEPDCCIAAGMGALAELVDTVGGVEFNVPVDMKYSDPSRGLYIDLEAGLQRLDGEQTWTYCATSLATIPETSGELRPSRHCSRPSRSSF